MKLEGNERERERERERESTGEGRVREVRGMGEQEKGEEGEWRGEEGGRR